MFNCFTWQSLQMFATRPRTRPGRERRAEDSIAGGRNKRIRTRTKLTRQRNWQSMEFYRVFAVLAKLSHQIFLAFPLHSPEHGLPFCLPFSLPLSAPLSLLAIDSARRIRVYIPVNFDGQPAAHSLSSAWAGCEVVKLLRLLRPSSSQSPPANLLPHISISIFVYILHFNEFSDSQVLRFQPLGCCHSAHWEMNSKRGNFSAERSKHLSVYFGMNSAWIVYLKLFQLLL